MTLSKVTLGNGERGGDRNGREPRSSEARGSRPRGSGPSSGGQNGNGAHGNGRGDGEWWPAGSFLGQLPESERAALLAAGTPCRFEDGQILLVQGEAGDFLYILTSGLVKVIVAAESGAETTLAIRSRGDLMGEFALLDSGPRTATARAAGPVAGLRVGAAAFLALHAGRPAVHDGVTRHVLAKMRSATERYAAERVWDARERMAQVLYELAEQHAQPGPDGTFRIGLTQGDLGDLAGVAVSTAERVLADFRRTGVVSTRYREITVRDKEYLASIRFPSSGQ